MRGRLPGAVLILVTPQLAPKTLGFLSSRPVRGQLAEPVPGCVGILTMLRALGSGCYLKLSAFFQSISFLFFFSFHFFKVFIRFVTILLLFWFFGHEACGVLAPRSGIEPAPLALEGEVLATGPPGKSLSPFISHILIPATFLS